MIVSIKDKIIDTPIAVNTFAGFSHPENRLVFFDGGEDPDHHILGGSIIAPVGTGAITDHIVAFLNKISSPIDGFKPILP